MVREINPPTRCKQTRHSMGTLSAHGDSLADTDHLTYVNCINFDWRLPHIDTSHIRALANSTPTYRPSLFELCYALSKVDELLKPVVTVPTYVGTVRSIGQSRLRQYTLNTLLQFRGDVCGWCCGKVVPVAWPEHGCQACSAPKGILADMLLWTHIPSSHDANTVSPRDCGMTSHCLAFHTFHANTETCQVWPDPVLCDCIIGAGREITQSLCTCHTCTHAHKPSW